MFYITASNNITISGIVIIENSVVMTLMALASSAAMVMASMGIAPAVMADEVEKPEKITVMFDGTVFTQENGQAEFEQVATANKSEAKRS